VADRADRDHGGEVDLLTGGPGPDRNLHGPGERPEAADRVGRAELSEQVRAAEIALLLDPAAPCLGFLAREAQAGVGAPPGRDVAPAAHHQAAAIPGPLA